MLLSSSLPLPLLLLLLLLLFLLQMNFEALFDKRIRPPWTPEIENVPLINENINPASSAKLKGVVVNAEEVGL